MTEINRHIGPVVLAPIDPERMKAMAVVLDDPNTIHLDPAVVQALGFGNRTINQGPANCGYVIDVLLDHVPGAFLERFAARFLGNVFSGDVLTVEGKVTEVDGVSVGCTVWLENQDRARVLQADAVLRRPV